MSARVLVVDDVATNLKLMEAKLTAEYYEVLTAGGGEAAINIVRNERPDIVLLDVMMPRVDGFEVCRSLKQDCETAHIPVVMVTALDQPSDRIAGLECGADDFLTKPVEDTALLARIRSLVRLKTMCDELRMREATSAAFRGNGEAPSPLIEPVPTDARIVVIEDRDRVATRLRDSLQDMGEVTILSPETDPVSVLSAHPCDVAMVSLGLRDRDGLRICSHIRSSEATRTVPLLAITEHGDNDRLVRALDLGVNDYITRPVDPNELVARTRTQIRRSRYERSLRELLHTSLRLAVTDSLTALYNRHYMQTHLDRLIREAKPQRPLSVLMLDIDFFKPVNDEHGHAAGDSVLVEVARRIQQSVRGMDLAARYGGEEFVIIMPDTESELASHVAERLRRSVSENPIALKQGGDPVEVTISVGVATSGEGVRSADDILDRADSALYEAKKSGRNRVVTARDYRFGAIAGHNSRATAT